MSDWKVSVSEILGRPGEYREFHIDRPVAGLRTTLARLDETPVEAHLRAESVVEGILFTGRVTGGATLECARCLTELKAAIDLDICELFVTRDHEDAAAEDVYVLNGQEVELEPMIRDAIALDLPLNPICRATCKGMCARCGADLNEHGCTCAEDEVDPRWAPLAALKAQLEG